MKKGTLFILSGPSGVGKGTIREKIMTMPQLNLAYSISMTTRKARVNEKNGEDYFFVSKEEFENAKKNGELLEWAEFVGNQYGTPKFFVDKLLNELRVRLNKNNIKVNFTNAVKKYIIDHSYNTTYGARPIKRFIQKNIETEIAKKIISSQKTYFEIDEDFNKIIQQRLNKAKREMKLQNDYKYVVINNTISKTSEEIANIITHYGNTL